jgi:hypothetical protein
MDRRGASPGRHVEHLEPRLQSQQRAQPLAEDDPARVEGITLLLMTACGSSGKGY